MLSKYFTRLGEKGGKKSVEKRMGGMTDEEKGKFMKNVRIKGLLNKKNKVDKSI